MHRLTGTTSGASLWGTGTYSYDAMGNMLASTIGARSFSYSGTTPKFSTVTESGTPRPVGYDASGNETANGSDLFEYGARNHLMAADATSYLYDGRGVRTITSSTVDRSSSTLSALTLDVSSVNSEAGATGTLTLTAPAPTGGTVIELMSDELNAATTPISVTVPAGNSSATFSVTTYRPAATTSIVLSAVHEDVLRTAPLTVVREPRIGSVLIPSSQTGNGTVGGTVTLDTPAFAGGATVALSSSHGSVSVPSQVVVAEGATTASFDVVVSNVTADFSATVTATLIAVQTANMNVYAPGAELATLSLKPMSVAGGAMSSTGTVTLTLPAGVSGAVVTLSSSNTTVAAVPTSVTIPAGSTSATFAVTTTATFSPTPVTITATYSATRTANLTVSSCGTWVADAVTPPTGDWVWFDDSWPSGASKFIGQNWLWDTNQKVTGTQSHTTAPGSGMREWSFYMGSSLGPLTGSNKVVTYALLDPCNPPREIMLSFHAGASQGFRAYWGENLINLGYDGTWERKRLGDLPPLGEWFPLEIPAYAVAIVGQEPHGMQFRVYDGRAWFDRTSKAACEIPVAAAPAIPSTDVIWFDDALPAGASTFGAWNWDTTQKASGANSHTAPRGDNWHEHQFSGASAPMTVGVGDKLMAYVQIDPCDPPGAVMLQFYDGDWNQRAYWGAVVPDYSFGPDGTPARLRIGDMPKFGVWTRLEVPAASLGLEGKTITGMKFSVWGGRAWFDAVGKVPSQGATQNLETEESVPVSLGVTTKFLAETNSTLAVDRYSLYTPELQLMAETNTTATTPWVAHEYIWFNGEPLAQVEVASGNLSYYFNDHLGAPILTTNSTGAVDWRVERDPYGERYATRVGSERHQPLGLPGQEYDASSDRQYNIFRWYRAGWGRYTQADPILREDFSTMLRQFVDEAPTPPYDRADWYGYGLRNPLFYLDPLGLKVKNNTNCRIYVKPGNGTKPVPVYPGGEYPGDQDGYADPCKFPNQVFKTVNGRDVTVGSDHEPSTSGGGVRGAVGQLLTGGWKDRDWQERLQRRKDFGWDQLFDKSDPTKCLCCAQ